MYDSKNEQEMSKQLKSIIVLLFVIVGMPTISRASAPADFASSVTVEESYDLNSPHQLTIWNKYLSESTPNGNTNGVDFFLSCLSDSDTDYGACAVNPEWMGAGGDVLLSFVEKRTHIKHNAVISGTLGTPCSVKGFVDTTGGCQINSSLYNVYITPDELKKFPIGGIWFAHLKLRTGQWHAGPGSIVDQWPGFMDAYWTADITLHITDNNNIRIWLPQFHGSTANVVMPVMPAYWALNKPGLVSAEKVVETCLYDGYNSNSQRFEVTLNSNYTDSTTQDFLLQNTSGPTSKPLHYQVLASPPGQSGAMQRLNPGITQTYTGINSTGIRQVIMPGLQTPVACVPWPIRIKLLPFDLSRQAAGHYNGTFSITFTPSLY